MGRWLTTVRGRLPGRLDLLHPFWRRAPLWLRRRLIWAGTDKFAVGVAALCLDPAGRLLLLEHRFHNEHPWGLPGGWADRGEAPEGAVLREVAEETGLEAEIERVVYASGDGEWVEIFFLCRVPAERPVLQQSEMLSYRWVDPHQLPYRLTRSQYRAVQHLLAALNDPERPPPR